MLSLNGKLSLTGKWTLDPKNGPASIPNVPEVVLPTYTVSQSALVMPTAAQSGGTSATLNSRQGIALSVAGTTAVLGGSNYSNSAGHWAIYEYNGTSWAFSQSLFGSTSAGLLGTSVSTNGTWMGAGALSDGAGLGYVTLHKKNAGAWSTTPNQTLKPLMVTGLNFGRSQSMTSDTLAVGADTDTVSSQAVGQVYIYTLASDTWTLQGTVNAGANQQAGAKFGYSVSVSGDTMVVGAPTENSNAGAAYVFTRSGGTWTLRARLVPSSPIANSVFGVSVKVQDGTIVVGASGNLSDLINNGSNSAVYVFEGSGATWTQKQVLTVSTTTGSTLVDANYGSGAIGQDVDISADGKVIITGGWKATANGKTSGGAVYVFEKTNNTWGASAIANSSSSLRLSTAGQGSNPENFGFQTKFHGSAIVATVPYRNISALQPQRGGFGYFK